MTINWIDAEKKAGISLTDKYKLINSMERVGEFFGTFIEGLCYVSSYAVKSELKRCKYPIGAHGGCRSRLNWNKISRCLGYESEREMHIDLYWNNELSYALEVDCVNQFTGENITPGSLYYRFKKLNIKRRPKGGANNIKPKYNKIR